MLSSSLIYSLASVVLSRAENGTVSFFCRGHLHYQMPDMHRFRRNHYMQTTTFGISGYWSSSVSITSRPCSGVLPCCLATISICGHFSLQGILDSIPSADRETTMLSSARMATVPLPSRFSLIHSTAFSAITYGHMRNRQARFLLWLHLRSERWSHLAIPSAVASFSTLSRCPLCRQNGVKYNAVISAINHVLNICYLFIYITAACI